MLAQTIFNAFFVAGQNCQLQDVIPSFLASKEGVLISVYTTSNDMLLSQNKSMNLLSEEGETDKITFFTLFMLNFEIFQDDSIKYYTKHSYFQSRFQKRRNPLSLELYKDPKKRKRKMKKELDCLSVKRVLMYVQDESFTVKVKVSRLT